VDFPGARNGTLARCAEGPDLGTRADAAGFAAGREGVLVLKGAECIGVGVVALPQRIDPRQTTRTGALERMNVVAHAATMVPTCSIRR